jgi:excisionase family DNA binding protein
MRKLTYTVTEAADLLGISRTSAYEAVHRGELTAITLGRRIVIPRTTLEQLLGPLDEPQLVTDPQRAPLTARKMEP